jgi:transcriptional regulator with XRE-family HTH domain
MKHPEPSHQSPHRTLGRFLKTMRQRLQESLGETSGAVEIAVEQLDRFERGAERPSEDILMLLISHFNLGDDEAVKVWELAGYDRRSQLFADNGRDDGDFEATHLRQAVPVMLLALDGRILYSNGAEIVTDESGVVLNFTQGDKDKPGQQPTAISRVGMSYTQAEELLATLQRALLHKQYLSGPKQLPPPTDNQ